MLTTSRKAQLGLNLVELMIGLVVGMIVLAAMTVVYLNASRGSKDTLNANRLNQDIRAVMDIMVADIRRAGYWATAAIATPNCFTTRTTTATCTKVTDLFINNAGNCILYSYDATYKTGSVAGPPAQDGIDFFGFRLNGGAVQAVSDAGMSSTDANTVCSTLTWQSLTDSNVINVSALTFSETGSQCLDATDPTKNWTAAGTTVPPCDSSDANYIAAVPASGDELAETRQITITITANHVQDNTLSRTLTETVLVRNNRILAAP